MAKRKRPKHPPLKARFQSSSQGGAVCIVRVPEGTDYKKRAEAIREVRAMAWRMSDHTPYRYYEGSSW